jgi:hypothetical protein
MGLRKVAPGIESVITSASSLKGADMHILASTCTRMVAVTAMVLGTGCGDDNGPGPSPPVVAKAATENGDFQSGSVHTVLPNALRVLVTVDGKPATGVPVTWAAGSGSGSLDPSSAETDAAGFSSSTWTLGFTPGTVTATASVANATGSPVTFTATVTGSGGGEDVHRAGAVERAPVHPEGTVSVTTLP